MIRAIRDKLAFALIDDLALARDRVRAGADPVAAIRAALPGWRKYIRRQRVFRALEDVALLREDETLGDWYQERAVLAPRCIVFLTAALFESAVAQTRRRRWDRRA